VGSSGLLGRAVTKALQTRDISVHSEPLDWADNSAFARQADKAIAGLAESEDWAIYWCAGSGVVGTSAESLADELQRFASFLDLLRNRLSDSTLNSSNGVIFFASSAGGVYAGSSSPPFTEHSPTCAVSDYGRTKLAAEDLLLQFALTTGVPVFIGRISNLYGPDQRLDKAQGLISQLCRSSLGGPPTRIYVSLDTIRDYIAADDCAGIVIDAPRRAQSEHHGDGAVTLKIVASHQPMTIAAIIGIFRSILKRPPHMMLASSPASSLQVRDLRFRSEVWTDLDQRRLTPISAGIHAVTDGMILRGRGPGS
jgi:UDP-glucose 4-epimerase